MKKKIVVGSDPHGMLAELKTALAKVQENCLAEGKDYEFILTGDLMNRGEDSFEVFKLVQNSENKISSVRGNHDEFFVQLLSADPDIVEKAIWLINRNGGLATLNSIIKYYAKEENKKEFPPKAKTKANVLRESFDLGQLVQGKLEKHPELQKMITDHYGADANAVNMFLCDALIEAGEFFHTLPLVRTIEQNGQKYVLCHSGDVPINENGKIMQNADKIGRKIQPHSTIDFGPSTRKGILWDRDKFAQRNERVDGHIVIHGHTYDKHNFIKTGHNGRIVDMNMDGGIAYGGVFRFVDLDSCKVYEIQGNSIIKEESLQELADNQSATFTRPMTRSELMQQYCDAIKSEVKSGNNNPLQSEQVKELQQKIHDIDFSRVAEKPKTFTDKESS